jgi:hypothetical protein
MARKRTTYTLAAGQPLTTAVQQILPHSDFCRAQDSPKESSGKSNLHELMLAAALGDNVPQLGVGKHYPCVVQVQHVVIPQVGWVEPASPTRATSLYACSGPAIPLKSYLPATT